MLENLKRIYKRSQKDTVQNSSNYQSDKLTVLISFILTGLTLIGIDVSEFDPSEIALLIGNVIILVSKIINLITHLLKKDKEDLENTSQTM